MLKGKFIYLNKKLPKYEAEIKAEADKKGFITSAQNCSVSVFVKKATLIPDLLQ